MSADLAVCRTFVEAHPADAATLLERIAAADAAALLDALPAPTAAMALRHMTPSAAAESLSALPAAAAAERLSTLPGDIAAVLLRRTNAGVRAALLNALPPEQAAPLRTLLQYPEGTAGALMDPRALTVPADISAGDALAEVRRSPRDLLSYLYVIDRDHRLVGVMNLRELLLAAPGQPVTGVMRQPVARLGADMGRDAILAHPGWHHYHALPVVGGDGVMLGAIRYRTRQSLDEETRFRRVVGNDTAATVVALSELYWLGLSGLVDGLASVVRRDTERDSREIDRGR